MAIQEHKSDLRGSTYMTELTAGTANLIISLQVFSLKQHGPGQLAFAPFSPAQKL